MAVRLRISKSDALVVGGTVHVVCGVLDSTLELACCRFRGHRDKVFMKPEKLHDEKSIQPRVQAGSGGTDH
ncbi:hypothetical protein, partial [Salipiger abyssi]|uniref:hypothetical protein n=1 Tax=Salipiger abyssi TaxID=1250539 RepID=UPI001A8EF9C7